MLKMELGDQLAYYMLIVYCVMMSLGVFLWNRLTDIVFIIMLLNCVIMFSYQKRFQIDVFVKLLFMFVLYSCVTSVWAANWSYALHSNESIIQRAGFAICTYFIVDTQNRVSKIVSCMFLGGIFAVSYMLVVYGYDGMVGFLSSETKARLGADITNVNTIATALAIAGMISWYYMLKCRKKYKPLFLMITGVFFLFIIASGSRTAFFGFVIGILCCSYLYSKSSKLLMALITIFIIVCAYLLVKRLGLMPGVISRFDEILGVVLGKAEISGSAKSRLMFAEYGLSKIIHNPIFGYGAGQFRYYMGAEMGKAFSSHNNYIELLFSYGLIGLALWYSMYLYCIVNLWRYSQSFDNSIIVSALIMRIVSDISGHSYGTSPPYLLLALAFACVRLTKKELMEHNVNYFIEGYNDD